MATFTEASMMSAEEDSTSSPDDDPYDDTDILNSAGTDEVTAHLAAAGMVETLQAGESAGLEVGVMLHSEQQVVQVHLVLIPLSA